MKLVKPIILFLVLIFASTVFSQESENTTENEEAEIEITDQNEESIESEVEKLIADSEAKAEKSNGTDDPNSASRNSRLVPLSRRTGFMIDRSSVPDTFVALDLVAENDLSSTQRETSNSIDVREIEFGFSGYIDWFASANVLFALHRENHGANAGEYIFDIHEAFIELYALPSNFRARIGRMFFDAGRLNGVHRHDWHFTNAPVIHKEVFNDTFVGEGAADTGIELSYLMPWDFFQELKVGVFRGRVFGHSHGDGSEKPAPLWTSRLKQFIPITGNWGTEFGFTYMRYHPTTNAQDIDQIFGSDFTVRWFASRIYMFTWSSEFWYKYQQINNAEPTIKQGFYSYVDFLFMQNYSVGYRFDYYSDELRALKLNRSYIGQSFWFTWRPSEFSYYRVNYEIKDYNQYENIMGTNHVIYVQGVFMLGVHPPHRY
ncbi:MAG: hypothetical protein KDK38_14450 [Leptospiraceae bacterium]|nr:hypothetical protein [Leptospiraceae bacterium]